MKFMNNARLLMTLTLFLFLVILFDTTITKVKHNTDKKQEKSVLSVETTPTPTPTPTPTETPIPTLFPTFTPIPTQTSQNQTAPDLQNFVYPGSQKINGTIYEHSDNPQTITDWYKNKIRDFGMNAKSFVQTNTNGNVLNKLVGSNGQLTITVEIENKNSQKTKITLTGTNN